MKTLITTTMLFLILGIFNEILGQQSLPIKFSVFNQGTNIPFSGIITRPIHPGIQLGTELPGKESERTRLYPGANLGYFFHNHLNQAVFTNVEMGYDVKLGFGLNIKSAIGVGYMHTFRTREEFQLEKGQYINGPDRGNSRVFPSLSLGLGYRFEKNNSRSTEIFTLYQSWIQYPFSPGFIPLMAHTNLHVGLKIYPFVKK